MILMYMFRPGSGPMVSFTHSVSLSKQEFIASEGQREFEITDFILTDYYILVVEDIIQMSNQTKAGQIITFTSGLNQGSRVVVYGICGTVSGSVKKQEFTATSGQTIFSVTTFTLTDNFIFVMDDVIQSGVSRVGNALVYEIGAALGSKIIIYG